jgi:hypothetical protein
MPRPSDMTDRQPSPEELRLLDLLYGEIEGEEEAAALRDVEADPARADEMAAFSRVRSLMRDLPEEEPPAALTAQLMHAAARAVPARRGAAAVPVEVEGPGLWERIKAFFRPVMMHPGLSAAATLVVVCGVAGVLYMTGNFDRAEPHARSGATPPATERRADEGRLLPVQPPTGGGPGAGTVELPSTASGSDITVDGNQMGEPANAQAEHRAQSAGGKAGGHARGPAQPAPARHAAPAPKAKESAPVANPPPDTSGAAGDRQMIEPDDAPAQQYKPPPRKPAEEPPPQVAPQPQAPAPPTQTETTKGNANSNYNRAVEEHKRALQAARDGECDAVVEIGRTIKNLDINYYNNTYRRDSRLTGCLKPPASKSPSAAP